MYDIFPVWSQVRVPCRARNDSRAGIFNILWLWYSPLLASVMMSSGPFLTIVTFPMARLNSMTSSTESALHDSQPSWKNDVIIQNHVTSTKQNPPWILIGVRASSCFEAVPPLPKKQLLPKSTTNYDYWIGSEIGHPSLNFHTRISTTQFRNSRNRFFHFHIDNAFFK